MEESQVHIPEEWVLNELGQLIKRISDGGTPSRSISRYFDGNIPWIVVDDIKDEIYSTKEYLTELGLKSCSSKFWDVNTIILSTGATIGVVGMTKVKAATKQGICGIELIESLDNKYMMYLLKSMKNIFLAYSQGSTIKEIRPNLIKTLDVVIPKSKTEQTKIATILSKVDEAITETERLIAKYTRIKTGLMQDLLTKGIDENGNIRSEKTHEFKDSPLGRIPKEWDYKTLGDNNIIELHNNKRKPISSKDRANMIGDYPYYGATGIIDMLNVFRVDGEFVLFGEDGDHFLKWVYQEQTILTNGKFNVSNHAHIVKGTTKCSTKWIHYFFCHRDITFYLTRQGAGRFKLNKASLLRLPILLPKSKNEQNAIIDRIEKVNEYSNNLNLRLIKLKSLKSGLMQDLLSGKVRVNHLIKETANV